MISNIHFKIFKALEDFTNFIKDFNVLTGSNNNGKSTVIDGIRVLQGAYRYASRHKPKFLNLLFDNDSFGYEIPEVSIPIILQNIQTNFNTDEPSLIKFKFKDGRSITISFHKDYNTSKCKCNA